MFRVTSYPVEGPGPTVLLDHPLLNGTPCARPQVTAVFNGSPINDYFNLYYDDSLSRWRIGFHNDFPVGTQFDVLVDPAQVAACTDVIFADGFDRNPP